MLVLLLLVLGQFFEQDVELFPESRNGVLGVLAQLITAFNLVYQQFPQLLVVILELLALESLLQDGFPVGSDRLHVCSHCVGGALADS